jgi:hypothetical protein
MRGGRWGRRDDKMYLGKSGRTKDLLQESVNPRHDGGNVAKVSVSE